MQWERPKQLFAHIALTYQGWQENVLLSIDDSGHISDIEANATPPEGVKTFDLLLPGMPNVHSHAFQRAMAGLTEATGGKSDDNFWSWRQVMYLFKQRLTPDHTEIIARHLYIELLKQGYTSVGEFHYLHHDAEGKAYNNPLELSERIIAAAETSGIHLTMLPVHYETSNFGGIPANDGQKRFVHNIDDFLKLVESLKARQKTAADMNLGVAPHSLRAVSAESLKTLLQALPKLGMADAPVHMHVSEQVKEVEDCITWSKKRPVEWLFENVAVGANWCLIHSTHTTLDELESIAKIGAVVGLCPTTEANLGDGIFKADEYVKMGGRFAIGSDSNVCVSPWEELRQMEYAQRLATRRRTVLCDENIPSVGFNLFLRASTGGAQALGIKAGMIAPGCRADLIALSADSPMLAGKSLDQLLDTLTFIMQQPPITHVWVAGKCVVENGRHAQEENTASEWRQALSQIID
jgi:formimidoylglutamate deiminase